MPPNHHDTIVGRSGSGSTNSRPRDCGSLWHMGEPSGAKIQRPVSAMSAPRFYQGEGQGHDGSVHGRVRKCSLVCTRSDTHLHQTETMFYYIINVIWPTMV